MVAHLKEAGRASLPVRLLRVFASGLVALALSGTALIVCSAVFEALEMRQKTRPGQRTPARIMGA